MKPGGERVVIVPPHLGFGEKAKELGNGVVVAANSILVCGKYNFLNEYWLNVHHSFDTAEVKLISVE